MPAADLDLAAIIAALPTLTFVAAAAAPDAPCYLIPYKGDWALARRHDDEGWSHNDGILIDAPSYCAPLPAPARTSPRQIEELSRFITALLKDGEYTRAASLIDELADAVRAVRDRG